MNSIIRIDTAAGQFVIRESDVADRLDARELWRHMTGGSQYAYTENPFIVEELFECLRGRPYDCTVVNNYVHCVDYNADRSMFVCETDISIDCDHLVIFRATKAVLRRRFHFFDDFFSEHPDVTTMDIPYSYFLLSKILCVNMYMQLNDWLLVLKFLNPKSNLYPFYFDLTQTSDREVLEAASRITTEENEKMVDYLSRKGHIVPSRTLPYTLRAFSTVRDNHRLMTAIYRDKYPSYLFCTLYTEADETWYKKEKTEAMFNWHFSVDQDDAWYSTHHTIECVKSFCRSYDCDDVEGVAKLLGLPIPTTLPYGVQLE